MQKLFSILLVFGLAAPTQGCVAALVAGGAVAVDELIEDDGEFDPLEEAYDGDDTTDPILDED